MGITQVAYLVFDTVYISCSLRSNIFTTTMAKIKMIKNHNDVMDQEIVARYRLVDTAPQRDHDSKTLLAAVT